ncbi:MAG TPA: aromatic ring-hydroxylating dioxygenase subunit alpha [Chloroflexota bacterium]
MLTTEQNDRLTRVGPGTPMGELMRRYWHPVATLSQMRDKYTKKVRLLGEDLVLYKDLSNTFGLVDNFCPHRRMSMIYGVPEERGLRCAYHGWLYSETGQCLEQPYEEVEDPEGRFKDKVCIKAYPVQEMAGLLFAYLGPQPTPLLPRWDVYTMEGMVRDIGYAVLPCNWLQCQENSLDPVHLEWLHVRFANYVLDRLGRPDLHISHKRHVRIGFDEFEYGIIKRRMVGGVTEEHTSWKDGHPIVFPNMLRQGGSGDGEAGVGMNGPSFQVRVPIDDYTTAHWWVNSYQREAGEAEQRPEDIPMYFPRVVDLDQEEQPRWGVLDTNSAQDPAAWISQGAIADRSQENLGRSDRGIIMFRKMLEDNIRVVESGSDPMNVFRDAARNQYLWMRTERGAGGLGITVRPRQGAATKYSPILNARGAEKPIEDVAETPA